MAFPVHVHIDYHFSLPRCARNFRVRHRVRCTLDNPLASGPLQTVYCPLNVTRVLLSNKLQELVASPGITT